MDFIGGACAIGEQPLKGLLNPKAMARMAVGEALTNLVWAQVTSLGDVKDSGNWMSAAKLDGGAAAMYDATMSVSESMIQLGIAIDGGKDSLSMAANAAGELVKAPGNLVISTYLTCPDITKTVTLDLKLGDDGILLHIDLAKGHRRLGGSALAQAFDQVGSECPDRNDVLYLKKAFEAVQELLSNCGMQLNLSSKGHNLLQVLFVEELGLVLEGNSLNVDKVMQKLEAIGISSEIIGNVTSSPTIELSVDGIMQLKEQTSFPRDLWEETSST
ncbi:probable phosphoribosylformylglycinamidine synthase, chloroplastic/mitochondrial [Zingiber officinale]|uniref:probable phosphoribosylformylglycinamidine synthase, chloroplastic/mitochondrial n=1 Tax=Zingiber officinale TaxID=94328 RepID=UPI001C4A9D72|nr:probable phosphoribosylformylglycinamidine synthase, chloroplastic/mitochondrial [Zingiber officinale]